MRLFAELLQNCINTPKTNDKINLIAAYFKQETAENIPYAFTFLIGKSLGRFCPAKEMRYWCAELRDLPSWLVDESYEFCGDNSETIAHLLAKEESKISINLHTLCQSLIKLKKEDIAVKKDFILNYWSQLDFTDLYCFNKCLGGGIRIGATKKNVLKALSQITDISVETLEHRLMGKWEPNQEHFNALINQDTDNSNSAQPYPFYLASALDQDINALITSFDDWIIESKWDGIRAQLVKRGSICELWSRGNDLITTRYPDIIAKAESLPDGVYDGELLAWKQGKPLSFNSLQKRLQRKKVSATLITDCPCTLMLYDVIEFKGKDIRETPLAKRKKILHSLTTEFQISKILQFKSYEEITDFVNSARSKLIEGVMIKHVKSHYKSGRVKGDWWKYKVAPLTLDLVVMYAQKGRGIRTGLYTDYTFGIWDNDTLVPITKAYSGLTNVEIKEVDAIIKKNVTEKFGPVRGVTPCIVMEIAFEGIHESGRHKSGLALRFPRIKRLRRDKPIAEANTLDDAKALL